ncbi:pseudouridine synthase [Spiroplasma turonicum]|uniref:Ribosomal large subunit pseudouridine synthase B n=1 Tax=Spiroplasma turonicum TaxID=216946 RepID=A0A0K1P764_9MOLU|nr:pseudouridine synthase [Spiroplasma turonicum]AKU80118.1 ribosomal large subunit pseudouridine synthase B [Spiroplasma turonicum]ALX71118.1 23S rRNA pseudouridine2605 synthase [Spiroplasma turonicum]
MNQERLQKIIASRGYCSRRKAEDLILKNLVKVNGKIINELGAKFEPNVEIYIDNKPVEPVSQKVYYLFNKPRLVLTTMADKDGRKTVADYFKNIKLRLFPVGRLDYDVSGAIIMTNDGEFANFVMHPRYEFQKTYQALCNGKVHKSQIEMLIKGVIIDENYKTRALDAKLLNYDKEYDESVIELTIAEGRKHHVKKMLIAADIYLKKLKRTRIEFLTLDDIEIGKYRELKVHEIKKFYGIYKSTSLR